jgi:selenide,water dikinase
MKQLNDAAGALARKARLSAATDITGYSLLGHAWEMASASQVKLRFFYDAIPFLSGARRHAEAWCFPGGAADNRLYFEAHVNFADSIDEASRMLLFDPQTSGGLLMAVSPEKLPALLEHAQALNQPTWIIGEALPGDCIEVV